MQNNNVTILTNTVCCLLRNKRKMKCWFFVFVLLLPLWAHGENCGDHLGEYIELEYIESTGTQYIDTGIVPDNSLSFECKFNASNTSDGYGNVFGARDDSASNEYQLGLYNNGMISIGSRNVGLKLSSGVLYTVSYEGGTNATINGASVTIRVSNLTTKQNIVLFAVNEAGKIRQQAVVKLYYCKFGNVRNFVPVKRRSDNVNGMYDMVSRTFFESVGNENFIAGPVKSDNCIMNQDDIGCPANTYGSGEVISDCLPCPLGTFSPTGSTSVEQCGRVLNVDNHIVYMPQNKRTKLGLCTSYNDKTYCADMYEKE